MTIWDGVRPLRIEIHGQPERSRYWAEVELGGMHARRVLLDSPAADGLEGMLRKVQDQFEAWEPVTKAQEPVSEAPAVAPEPVAEEPPPRRRGRPPKARVADPHKTFHESRGHD